MPDRQPYPEAGAVILAGGRSSRMGTPKAWLDWGGQPLLCHLVEVVRNICTHIVVVGAPEQELPELPQPAIRIDDPPELRAGGPLVGLHTGLLQLRQYNAEIAFLGACDGVMMTGEHIAFVIDALRGDSQCNAIVPVDDEPPQYAHPLASAIRVVPALATTTALLEASIRRPIRMFERLGARTVPVSQLPDAKVVQTCNTPEAYRAAREAVWGTGDATR